MRLALAVIALLAVPFSASAVELEAKSSIDAVTVYPDGATVTRVIRADLAAGDNVLLLSDFPVALDPSSLRVEGEARAKLTIGAIDTRMPRPVLPANLSEIDKRIEALRDERAALDDAIAAATARREFAEHFAEASPAGLGEKGEARPISEWRAAFVAVAEEVAAAADSVRQATIKQRDIDRSLARLEAERNAKPPQKLELRISLNAAAASTAMLRVTYAVRGARWTPLYDARLDTGDKERKPSLELIRRAEIKQSTGEDWDNVALTVSTARTAKGGNAPELKSLLAHYPDPELHREVFRYSGGERFSATPKQDAQERTRGLVNITPPPMEPDVAHLIAPALEQQATIETGGFQAVFHVPGRISLAAQQSAKSFRINSTTITPELSVRAVPVLEETAFLEASFKHTEEAPLLPGLASIYRDGIFVGRSPMALTPKDETARLGFGADDKIKIARAVVRQTEGTRGLVHSSKTDRREFKITLHNGHDFPIKASIEDQIPVSENDAIKVEMLADATPPTTRDLRDRRGVMEWSFTAEPGKLREIKHGWSVRWPKDETIVFEPR